MEKKNSNKSTGAEGNDWIVRFPFSIVKVNCDTLALGGRDVEAINRDCSWVALIDKLPTKFYSVFTTTLCDLSSVGLNGTNSRITVCEHNVHLVVFINVLYIIAERGSEGGKDLEVNIIFDTVHRTIAHDTCQDKSLANLCRTEGMVDVFVEAIRILLICDRAYGNWLIIHLILH